MSVETAHPAYIDRLPDWELVRTVIAGQRAMRDAGEKFVRRFMGMEPDEYTSYVSAASFFGATERTLEGLTGLAFYSDPTIELPDGLDAFEKDATQDGVPLRQFIESTFEEVMQTARPGVLVDMPPRDPNVRNRRDEEALQLRPYLTRYTAEQIINWRTARVHGAIALVEVRLKETEQEIFEEFKVRVRERIRVLELVPVRPEGGGPIEWQYRQRLFVAKWMLEDGSEFTPEGAKPTRTRGKSGAIPNPTADGVGGAEPFTFLETITPTLPGEKPLPYIPFWIINPTDQSADVKKPPLLSIAELNATHFNVTAMLDNGLFWASTGQPYATGVDPDDKRDMVLGSSRLWKFKDPATQVGILSLGTEGSAAVEKRLDRIEQQMAVLGARMMAPEKKAAEAAETARIHRSGEISVVAGVCASLSAAFTDICSTVRDWAGETGDVKVELSTDFFDQELTVADCVEGMKLWQNNLLHVDDLVAMTKRARIADATRNAETIVSGNQSSPIQPIMPGLTGSSGGVGGPALPSPTLRAR